MTAIANTYFLNPFKEMVDIISFAFELNGYMRAARELQSLGYYEEAQQAMQYARELIASRN